MNWVPVELALPKQYEPVLVSGGVAFLGGVSWYTMMTLNEYNKPAKIQWEVTHWMPIPVLPKEVGDEGRWKYMREWAERNIQEDG